jgi:hypothetical protein
MLLEHAGSVSHNPLRDGIGGGRADTHVPLRRTA